MSNKAINVLSDMNHATHVVTWVPLVLETLNISRPSPRPSQRCINSGCLSRKAINLLDLPYTELIQTLSLYSRSDAWEGGREGNCILIPASLTLGVTVARSKTQIPGILSPTFINLTFRLSNNRLFNFCLMSNTKT